MKLCFVVDARSPIAQNWIRYFIDHGHDVHIISSYPCESDVIPGAKLQVVPLGLTALSRIRHDGSISHGAARHNPKKPNSLVRSLFAQIRSGRLSFISDFVTNWLVPLDLYRQSAVLRKRIQEIQPDLVHAMRIPREGVAAALATPDSIPLILSVWGNDFTLWAKRNPLRALQIRLSVERADAIHSDCQRDMKLACDWGFDAKQPSLVVPGSGGIKLDIFYPAADRLSLSIREKYHIPEDTKIILNPRGIRGYVRNDIFFEALSEIVISYSNIHVLCTGMRDNPVIENWINQRNLERWVTLLPNLNHSDMSDLFRVSDISVSLSEHDGTPNTLLEAMASGCFIVAGDIESVREWIATGQNGLLCDPTSKEAVAQTIIQALHRTEQQSLATIKNREIIKARADYAKVMPQVWEFYKSVVSKRSSNIV